MEETQNVDQQAITRAETQCKEVSKTDYHNTMKGSVDEFYNIWFNSSPIGIYIVQHGKFRFVNIRFWQDSGYTQDELLGTDSLNLVHPDDRKMVRENAIQMLKRHCSAEYEYRIVTKSGDMKWILETVAPIEYRGEPATLGYWVNVTQRKKAEEELNQTLSRLARSNAELEQFAYVASHDLQEPLRMVSSYTQLLAKRYQGKLDETADEFIAYAVDGAHRMQVLINDLLTYSRITTRGKPFEPVHCEVVLSHVLTNLKVAIEESGAQISYGPLPKIIADSTQLEQLFQNLISNAIRFRRDESPRINIKAEQKEDDWLFSVRDNGIGIDPEYHDRIFVIFRRLHNRSKYSGNGIGLALCKKIVERHGGKIWVESQIDKGSIFNFTIPIKGGEDCG